MVVARVLEHQVSDQCPRCGEKLRQDYRDQEPECWICGFVDYSRTSWIESPTSLVASATRFMVRYIGSFPEMKERLVLVHVVRGRGAAKIAHRVNCPFCNKPMTPTTLSVRRKRTTDDRYICAEGHRMSLLRSDSGDIGWK